MRGLKSSHHELMALVPSLEVVFRDLSSGAERHQRHHLQRVPDQTHTHQNQAIRWDSLWMFLIIGCLFSTFPIANAFLYPMGSKDYKLWYSVGRAVIAGAPLYGDVQNGEPDFMYPPTAAVMIYGPLSYLHPVLFTAILCLTTAISWSVALWAARVLISGNWTDRLTFLSLAPGFVVASYVWDVQLLGQLNLCLLALTLSAFVLSRRGHPWLSGGLFGAAVAIKVFPLPAIAYFVVRRQWTAVAATLISIVAFAWFLPGLIRGFERNTAELQQWAQLMIADQSGQTMAGRSSIGFTRRNQSLVSLSHRLLRRVDAGDRPDHPLYVNVTNVSPKTAQLIGYGTCLLLGLVLLIACRFQFGTSMASEGVEIAMVCTLVPLCSPLAWTYFFCWLLPAWTAIAHWINHPLLAPRIRQNMLYGIGLGATLLLSAISEQFDATLQALGVTALGAVVLFLTLAYLRFNLPASPGNLDELEPVIDGDLPPAAISLRPKPK